jgi:uncharacterized protein
VTPWQNYKQTMIVPPSLWSAAKANDLVALERLLADGLDINGCDVRGFSPLMLAAYAGHLEAFDYLLARGADPNGADLAGNTILMGAAFKGFVPIVEKLLAAGADRSVKNHSGLDARGFALAFGRTQVVDLFDRS